MSVHDAAPSDPDAIIESTRQLAVASLLRCCVPSGLMASGSTLGHHQVWARDSMISLLGGRLVKDAGLKTALLASIETLKTNATAQALIPNNVAAVSRKVNFRAYADTGLWWIIGSALMAPDKEMTRAILRWYACQDIDQSGLLSMQEGADWQDLFCTRGKGLTLNALYVQALRSAASVIPEDAPALLARAERVCAQVNRWFWYQGDGNMLRHISHTFSTESLEEHDSLGRKRWLPTKKILPEVAHYLPYLGFRVVGEWFDTFGHLLAIVTGIASAERAGAILDFMAALGMEERPAPAIHPVIHPGDADWRDYYGALNLPYCYHNGGIWPFIGGFYVAALVKCGRMDAARRVLAKLAALNSAGHFNEWHHGQDGSAKGVEHQAWSAGMYLFALDCVETGRAELAPG